MLKKIFFLVVIITSALSDGGTQTNKFPVHVDTLLGHAILGADYLVNALMPDGKYVYEYNPKTGHRSWKYNILRHAGTTYSILEVYEVTGEEKYLDAAKEALEYLKSTIKPCKSKLPNTSCVVEDGEVKLGGNALAVIAMAKYTSLTGDKKYLPAMQSLAGWMKATMGRYGEFKVHKQTYPEGPQPWFRSNYYPGEALLAFTRLYAVDRDTAWLDAAANGAYWLINIRDRNKTRDDLDHDHWLLYALNDLYTYRPDSLYLNHANRIVDAILHMQRQVVDPVHPDWTGSYYTPPRSTPTATRSEGLVSAYHLAVRAGDAEMAKQILNGIHLGIQFQLRTQCGPADARKMVNPPLCLGGFFESLDEYNIRIDYVQHNISAILGYYAILKNKS